MSNLPTLEMETAMAALAAKWRSEVHAMKNIDGTEVGEGWNKGIWQAATELEAAFPRIRPATSNLLPCPICGKSCGPSLSPLGKIIWRKAGGCSGYGPRNQGAPVVRDREADRRIFPDVDFNAWLDLGISDCGHTVYDSISSIEDAWNGWLARATPTGWQPIDTAPKGGSEFLGWAPGLNVAIWYMGQGGLLNTDCYMGIDATHWMPAPAEPAPDANA